jgi:ADP-heptose:LPS heptosyltransferase
MAVPYDSRRYEAERVGDLLIPLGLEFNDNRLEYNVPASDQQIVDTRLRELKLDPGRERLVVLAPGAGWPGKLWGEDNFARLADTLAERYQARCLLAGSAGEAPMGARIQRRAARPLVNGMGTTTWDQLAALMARAGLFIGNDSGPMHLAAVFDVPSLVIFGPTVASKWAPRSAHNRVLQSDQPCDGCWGWHPRAQCVHDHRCMRSITVERAVAEIERLLPAPERVARAGA